MLTPYEVTKIIGIRALQISEGVEPHVVISDERLRRDAVYVAARELYEGKADACVTRQGVPCHVSQFTHPMDLMTMLNTRDGSSRIYGASGASIATTASQ
jgi:DNA-directed RNA polymerase subunit K/omega